MLDADRRGPWTAREIALAQDVATSTVRNYLRRLVAAGFAEVAGERANNGRMAWLEPSPTYRLLSRRGLAPRIDKQGRVLPETQTERLWRGLKMAHSTTAQELAALVTDEGEAVKPLVVRRYLRELAAVGIVRRQSCSSRGVEARYLLVRKLGPRAPKIAHGTHAVSDPNEGDAVLIRLGPA